MDIVPMHCPMSLVDNLGSPRAARSSHEHSVSWTHGSHQTYAHRDCDCETRCPVLNVYIGLFFDQMVLIAKRGLLCCQFLISAYNFV